MEDYGTVKLVDWQAVPDEDVNRVVSALVGYEREWAASNLAALTLLQAMRGEDITIRLFKSGGVSIIINRQIEIFGETFSGAVARAFATCQKSLAAWVKKN